MSDASPAVPASQPIWPPVSSGVRPSLVRYLFRSDDVRWAFLLVLVSVVATIVLFYAGGFLWSHGRLKAALFGLVLMAGGAIAGLIAVFSTLMSVLGIPRELRSVRDDPLVPGIVVSTRPKRVMMLVETGRVIPGGAYALAEIQARTLGPIPPEPGGRIACFTRPLAEYEAARIPWIEGDVVACATGDAFTLEECNLKIGVERFRLAEEAVRRGPLPGTTMQFVFFDRDLEYVGCWRTKFNQAIEGNGVISGEIGFIPAEQYHPTGV